MGKLLAIPALKFPSGLAKSFIVSAWQYLPISLSHFSAGIDTESIPQ